MVKSKARQTTDIATQNRSCDDARHDDEIPAQQGFREFPAELHLKVTSRVISRATRLEASELAKKTERYC